MKFQYLLGSAFFCFLSFCLQAGDNLTGRKSSSKESLKVIMAKQWQHDSDDQDSDNEFYDELNEKIKKLSSDDYDDAVTKFNRGAIPQAILDQLQNKKLKNKNQNVNNSSCVGVDWEAIPDESSDRIPQEELDALFEKDENRKD